MITISYATQQQLADYLHCTVGDLPTDVDRLLDRATELVNDVTRDLIDTSDSDQSEAATNAVCAQVEWWQQVGEGVDQNRPIRSYSAGRVSVTYESGQPFSATALAPRAQSFLRRAGLLYRGADLA